MTGFVTGRERGHVVWPADGPDLVATLGFLNRDAAAADPRRWGRLDSVVVPREAWSGAYLVMPELGAPVNDTQRFALIVLLAAAVGLVAVLSNRLAERVKVPRMSSGSSRPPSTRRRHGRVDGNRQVSCTMS